MPHFLTRCLASALAICAVTEAAHADTFLYRHKPATIGASTAPTPEPEQPPVYDDEQFRNLTFESQKGSKTSHWGYCGSSAFPTPYYADCDGDGSPNEQFANDGATTASDTNDQWVAVYNSENAAKAYRNVPWSFPDGRHTSPKTATMGPFKASIGDGGEYGVSVDVLTAGSGPNSRFARIGKLVDGQLRNMDSTSARIRDGEEFYFIFDANEPFSATTYRVNLTAPGDAFHRLKAATFRMD